MSVEASVDDSPQSASSYRALASECLAKADAAALPNEASKLRMSADRWLKLAALAERVQERSTTAPSETDRVAAGSRGARRRSPG